MLKKIAVYLVTFIIIAGLGFWIFVQINKPKYEGNLTLEDLEEKVDVYFDEVGVPHIYAQNQHDAYVALGYVHAQDRLWQMELIRRVGAGRLSEIFGKEMIKTDQFFKGLGIEKAAARDIKNLDTTTQAYALTMAYLNGINQFIEKGVTPVEYRLAGGEN